jgi:outer membrane lipoprotein SlyB
MVLSGEGSTGARRPRSSRVMAGSVVGGFVERDVGSGGVVVVAAAVAVTAPASSGSGVHMSIGPGEEGAMPV